MYIFTLMALLGISACRPPSKVDRAKLLAYVNDKSNGLRHEQTVNGVHIELAYKPSSLFVADELYHSRIHDSALIATLEKKYMQHYYFILKVSKGGKEAIRQLGSFNNYSDMLQLFAFDMQSHINITADKDTVPVADYHFDQTYGMSNGNNILLSFNNSSLKNKRYFNINLKEFGLATGSLVFTFKESDIANEPLLDYSSHN